jgi:hypothetical protein
MLCKNPLTPVCPRGKRRPMTIGFSGLSRFVGNSRNLGPTIEPRPMRGFLDENVLRQSITD